MWVVWVGQWVHDVVCDVAWCVVRRGVWCGVGVVDHGWAFVDHGWVSMSVWWIMVGLWWTMVGFCR